LRGSCERATVRFTGFKRRVFGQPSGQTIAVDLELADVVAALWRRGIDTAQRCQAVDNAAAAATAEGTLLESSKLAASGHQRISKGSSFDDSGTWGFEMLSRWPLRQP
jgi:hypothetical protein